MKNIKDYIFENTNKRNIVIEPYVANAWTIDVDGHTQFIVNKDGYIFKPDETVLNKQNAINGSKDKEDLKVYHCFSDDEAVNIAKMINKEIKSEKVVWDMFRTIK